MKISPINGVYQNYGNSFKAKPKQSAVSKVMHKALLPTAICAYVFSPLLGMKTQKPQKEEFNQVQYEQEFMMNNTKYTMTYVNTAKEFGENAVSEIYLTPKKSNKFGLRVENVYKNVVNDSIHSVTADVTELKTGNVFNIDLPNEIGDEILNLYDGKTDLFVVPGINTYSEINVND